MVGSRERYEVCMEAAGIALAAGDRADAERALRGGIQAIEGLSDFRAELSSTLVKLGSLKQEVGSYAEAEDLFRKALDVGERVFGSHDVGLVPALTGIGASRIMQGNPEQAHPFLARALDLSERHFGGEGHPDLVILLNDLSRLYLKQSAYEYAEPLLLRLLALKRVKGEDHPEVATVLASLASVRQSLGRHDSAEQLWRRVLEIRERTLAPNHFSLATTLEHLASTLAARGKSNEALQLYQRALSIRELTLGADHASLRVSRERIADLQLQASEDSLDGDGPITTSPPAAPLRLSSGERFGVPVRATLVTEKPSVGTLPLVSLEVPSPFEPETARPAATVAAKATPRETATTATKATTAATTDAAPTLAPPGATKAAAVAPPAAVPKDIGFGFEPLMPPLSEPRSDAPRTKSADKATPQASAEDPPYLKVLLEIKDELEQTEALTRTNEYKGMGKRAGAMLAATSAFFKHRRAAVIVGISAITLPVLAMAMANVARSNTLSQRDDRLPILPAALTDSVVVTSVTLQGSLARPTEAQKDSAPRLTPVASKPSSSRTRPTEAAPAASQRADTAEQIANWIPTLPRPTIVRLDSVVGAIAARPMVDPTPIQLTSGSDNIVRPDPDEAENGNAAQRARLIGSLPKLKYPARLYLAKVGGEVLVRFQVDTAGRPVMNTFSVVSSPDAGLTAAVRRVIPTMRFEPARSPAPHFKATTDVMEIGFRFSPDSRD